MSHPFSSLTEAELQELEEFLLYEVQCDEGMTLATTLQPKVGRNEECPCGSGKKYDHCFGAAAALH